MFIAGERVVCPGRFPGRVVWVDRLLSSPSPPPPDVEVWVRMGDGSSRIYRHDELQRGELRQGDAVTVLGYGGIWTVLHPEVMVPGDPDPWVVVFFPSVPSEPRVACRPIGDVTLVGA